VNTSVLLLGWVWFFMQVTHFPVEVGRCAFPPARPRPSQPFDFCLFIFFYIAIALLF
jgi:hypothetical protein